MDNKVPNSIFESIRGKWLTDEGDQALPNEVRVRLRSLIKTTKAPTKDQLENALFPKRENHE